MRGGLETQTDTRRRRENLFLFCTLNKLVIFGDLKENIIYHDSAGLLHENNQSLWYKHLGKSEFNMFSNV